MPRPRAKTDALGPEPVGPMSTSGVHMSTEATRLPARTGTGDPVRAVSVISTGSVEIHPEHAYGSRKPLYWWLLTSRRWLPPRPINVYVIEHANGLVLFDTGQDRASVTDPSYFPGGFN